MRKIIIGASISMFIIILELILNHSIKYVCARAGGCRVAPPLVFFFLLLAVTSKMRLKQAQATRMIKPGRLHLGRRLQALVTLFVCGASNSKKIGWVFHITTFSLGMSVAFSQHAPTSRALALF
jgi:hypothetical protein